MRSIRVNLLIKFLGEKLGLHIRYFDLEDIIMRVGIPYEKIQI